MEDKNQQQPNDQKDLRIAGSTVGGMLLAGSLFGPAGAIIGGALGFLLGKTVTEEENKEKGEGDE